jgi:hypothetical protein
MRCSNRKKDHSMATPRFLLTLYQTGRITLPAAPAPPEPESIDVDLAALDALARLSLPPAVPPLHLPTARWAACLLYGAICCYAFRDWDAQKVADILATPCPSTEGASPAQVSFSVDLSLQFLPDLFQLARGIAPGDPLIVALLKIGRDWPLSSVGIADVDADPTLDISAFIQESALLTLYLDRIFARRATARLGNPQVARYARAAIGLHDALAPEVASSLHTQEVA